MSRTLLFLAALLALLASAGCGGGGGTEPDPLPEPQTEPLRLAEVVPGSGIRLYQVDFEDEKTPYRHTTWGRILVDPAEVAKMTGIEDGWLNVATEGGWAVVNLPMPPAGEPPFAVYFDLGLDEPEPQKLVPLCVRLSNRAVGSTGSAGGFLPGLSGLGKARISPVTFTITGTPSSWLGRPRTPGSSRRTITDGTPALLTPTAVPTTFESAIRRLVWRSWTSMALWSPGGCPPFPP